MGFQQGPKATVVLFILFYFTNKGNYYGGNVQWTQNKQTNKKKAISSLVCFHFQTESHCVALVLMEFDV